LQVKTDLRDTDGHFIAGFIGGEAHLAVVEQNGGQSYSCAMTLGVRDDDADLLRRLAARTGLGTVHPVPALDLEAAGPVDPAHTGRLPRPCRTARQVRAPGPQAPRVQDLASRCRGVDIWDHESTRRDAALGRAAAC
jgi:hypothetical protein